MLGEPNGEKAGEKHHRLEVNRKVQGEARLSSLRGKESSQANRNLSASHGTCPWLADATAALRIAVWSVSVDSAVPTRLALLFKPCGRSR